MTVGEALRFSVSFLEQRGMRQPRADSEVLLASLLGRERVALYSHPERLLEKSEERLLDQWLRLRGQHWPVQYLVGYQEFYGLKIAVRPGVFIPRPETELLVENALRWLSRRGERVLRVADVCTGSGCVAIALAHQEPRCRMVALDRCGTALTLARGNARQHGVAERISFLQTDMLASLSQGRPYFHLVLCNPPYVPLREAGAVDPSVRCYEPSEAVFAGPDGLDATRTLLEQSRGLLEPEGCLLLELGRGSLERVRRVARALGWVVEAVDRDRAGIERVALLGRGGDSRLTALALRGRREPEQPQ